MEIFLRSKYSMYVYALDLQWWRLISFRYIFADLLGGGDLRSFLDFIQRGRKDICLFDSEACLFSHQIFKALEHLHRQNIIHRDLKPENILLSAKQFETRIILADFGSAYQFEKTAGPEKVRKMTVVGTPEYLAPYVSYHWFDVNEV